ncbi:MAG: hypothetical protein JRJ29_11625 [Deltaproteobacteria bacterium]|nr:hypothetical protein [Deltaproteobacteria bacterium]
MNCKNCGGETRVLKTRNMGVLVHRVRQCQSCLYVFNTYEEEGGGREFATVNGKPPVTQTQEGKTEASPSSTTTTTEPVLELRKERKHASARDKKGRFLAGARKKAAA